MKRLSAFLLLGLFSYLLIVPALFADSDSSLPACCRKDGKHHCSMSSMDATDDAGATVKSVASKCPVFPTGRSAPASAKFGTPVPSQDFEAPIASYPTVQAQAEIQYRVSFDRSSQKRGPPSLL